jgi:hypothetical protein
MNPRKACLPGWHRQRCGQLGKPHAEQRRPIPVPPREGRRLSAWIDRLRWVVDPLGEHRLELYDGGRCPIDPTMLGATVVDPHGPGSRHGLGHRPGVDARSVGLHLAFERVRMGATGMPECLAPPVLRLVAAGHLWARHGDQSPRVGRGFHHQSAGSPMPGRSPCQDRRATFDSNCRLNGAVELSSYPTMSFVWAVRSGPQDAAIEQRHHQVGVVGPSRPRADGSADRWGDSFDRPHHLVEAVGPSSLCARTTTGAVVPLERLNDVAQAAWDPSSPRECTCRVARPF